MYNLLMKELKLGVSPFFYIMPVLFGALMFIPGWLYFLVPLYFCFITIPNMFAGYKTNNDLIFTTMMPVVKKDMVKAKIAFVVILEMMHIISASLYGLITVRLYPDLTYIFYAPTAGFWGLCFVMLGIFNLIFFPIYYKTAYKYGVATFASIVAAVLFAGGAEWVGIQNQSVRDLFKGAGVDNISTHLIILIGGIAVFALLTIIAYYISNKRFGKVEL